MSWDEDDAAETVACRYCGEMIPEDTPRCPYCENYISDEEVWPRKPWWIIIGVGVCLWVVYRWIMGG